MSRFDYTNKNGNEQWWIDNNPVSKIVYGRAFMRLHGIKIDYNNVGFEDMIKMISDGEYCGYYSTPYKTYKFYAEKDTEFGSVDIKVQVDAMDMSFGDFFQEYEFITDWISYRFLVKKTPKWIPCDFKQANRLYNSGGFVRCEIDGKIEEFNKTAKELKCLIDVASVKQIKSEWEYRV